MRMLTIVFKDVLCFIHVHVVSIFGFSKMLAVITIKFKARVLPIIFSPKADGIANSADPDCTAPVVSG